MNEETSANRKSIKPAGAMMMIIFIIAKSHHTTPIHPHYFDDDHEKKHDSVEVKAFLSALSPDTLLFAYLPPTISVL
jgi:hypothetical protein